MATKKKVRKQPKKLSRETRKARTHNHEAVSPNFIAKWREYRQVGSQSDLARLSGITRATICRLENGTLPHRAWLLDKLAEVLHCAPAALIMCDPFKPVPDVVKFIRSLKPEDQRAIRAEL